MDFYIEPGGPGGHSRVSRTYSGAENHQKHWYFQNFVKMQKGVADCRLRLESRKIADYD